MSDMKTTDVTLTVRDLLRIRRWYQTFAADASTQLEAGDLVLDAMLRVVRYDMQDRDTERVHAVRAHHSNKQHVGPERRARVEEVQPEARRLQIVRTVRPVIKALIEH